MFNRRVKTAKILSFTLLFLVTLGFLLVSSALAEEKKPTVTLVWEKKMDMEYSFRNQYIYDQLAENYFKAQERVLSGQVGEKENVIVMVPNQEVRFMDRQGNVVKRIPLRYYENPGVDEKAAKGGTAYLSPEGKYVGISFFDSTDETSTFELLDAAGNVLWQNQAEPGRTFSKAFITSNANNTVLLVNDVEDDPAGLSLTLQFFSKDGAFLKEYTKSGFVMREKEIWMDKQENINVIFERGYVPPLPNMSTSKGELIWSRLEPKGELIWERDISGFLPSVSISPSGEYYLMRKVEGNEAYVYIFKKDGTLSKKFLQSKEGSWLSPDADFLGTRTGDQIQFTSLSTGIPVFNVDSRRLPGEEKTNTSRTSYVVHPSGLYFLLSLVKEKDLAPGWVVILDSNKKVYQITYPKGNVSARFSKDGKFIRVNNYAENKIMLYGFEY
jgi:hypothetical protein